MKLDVADITILALEVFGDPYKVKSWLTTKNTTLAGIKPIEIISDDLGRVKVLEIINCIKFGIYS